AGCPLRGRGCSRPPPGGGIRGRGRTTRGSPRGGAFVAPPGGGGCAGADGGGAPPYRGPQTDGGPPRVGGRPAAPPRAVRRPHAYFLRHVWVTTSAMFSLPPVLCSISVFGVDRVLFSVDYPFAANASGRELLDMLPLAPADKAKVAGLNAERLLRLK